jgi:hypothetical protein
MPKQALITSFSRSLDSMAKHPENPALACLVWSPADWETFVEDGDACRLQVVCVWARCRRTGAPLLWETQRSYTHEGLAYVSKIARGRYTASGEIR